jgi:hypothetical protein
MAGTISLTRSATNNKREPLPRVTPFSPEYNLELFESCPLGDRAYRSDLYVIYVEELHRGERRKVISVQVDCLGYPLCSSDERPGREQKVGFRSRSVSLASAVGPRAQVGRALSRSKPWVGGSADHRSSASKHQQGLEWTANQGLVGTVLQLYRYPPCAGQSFTRAGIVRLCC